MYSSHTKKFMKLKYDHLEEVSKLEREHIQHISAIKQDFVKIEGSLMIKLVKERFQGAGFTETEIKKVIHFES